MRIKLNRLTLILPLLAAALCGPLFAQAKSEGMKLFEQNKPAEAIAFLEADIASGNPLPEEYNYLGLSYYQIGNYEKSAEAFKKGTSVGGTRILPCKSGRKPWIPTLCLLWPIRLTPLRF